MLESFLTMRFALFPAFFDRPEKMSFGEQEPDEVVELLLRRHWVTNLPWIFVSLLGFSLPAVIIALTRNFNINFFSVPGEIAFGLIIVWYMLILGYVIEQFLYWYYNIYIVTTKHLVDVNFHSLLYRDVTESAIDDIQSVSSKIKGIFGSLFNYGDVIAQTAAEIHVISFLDVPFPDLVADRIEDLRASLNP